MAMLAEKKRREKWCLNPMGNYWAKDENKFGQKMLEKMGWQPGTGLGSRGQGPTEIIKINVKNDTLGLGSKHDNQKEVWTKQLVDYDSLLAELNGPNSKSEERESEVLPSLEEKSKTSRARVHYHKFTRGKDVSKYSSKDLSCILPLHKIKEDEKSTTSENNMYAYFNKKINNPYKDNSDENSFLDALDEEISTVEKMDATSSNPYKNISDETSFHDAPDKDISTVGKTDSSSPDTSDKNRKKKKRKTSDLDDISYNKHKKKKTKLKSSKPKNECSDTLVIETVENNCADNNFLVSNEDESCIPLTEIELGDKMNKKKRKKKYLKKLEESLN